QFALPIQPLQLPDAERDTDQHHRDREQRRRELRPKPAHARGGSWCSRLCLYCSAMSAAFNGRSIRIAPPRMSGVHNRRCSQTGGANLISTMAASPTTISPRKRMTNTAGPSPASCVDKVPVPSRRLEPEMVIRLEMPLRRAPQADREKDRADDDMEAVEAGRHEEGRRVDATGARDALVKAERKRGMAVFVGLHRGEA